MDNNLISEFYVSANEYCKMLEYTSDYDKDNFLSTAQKIASLVYLKASLLPKSEEFFEGELEQFVQEEDWIYIKNNVSDVLESSDVLIEVSLPEGIDPDNTEDMRLSDVFADVYQDLKNFVSFYEIAKQQDLKYALYDCINNFEQLWGQKLLSILITIHNILYNNLLASIDNNNFFNKDADTSDWLISQKFNS